MGLLDQLGGPIVQEVMSFVNNHEGGLTGLVEKLKSSGLTDQVNSWIGTGANQPVNGSQISNALGSDALAKIAEKLGVSHEEAAQHIAGELPEVINQLTPNGKIEVDDILKQGISSLKGLFG